MSSIQETLFRAADKLFVMKREVRRYFATLGARGGAKGGLAGGKAKVRGGAAYYREIGRKGHKARAAKKRK